MEPPPDPARFRSLPSEPCRTSSPWISPGHRPVSHTRCARTRTNSARPHDESIRQLGQLTLRSRGGGMKRKRESISWLFVEPTATIAIGLVLYFPLSRPDLAELTGIFGALLVIA